MKPRYPSEPVLVEIDELHPEGYARGRGSDFEMAVFGALPGEQVSARAIRRRGRQLFGRAESLHRRAPQRIEPACSHCSRCAGCCFQHLDSTAQLEFKEQQLRGQLDDLTPEAWLPPLSGPLLGYRSKARLGVKYVEKKGRVLIGFREKMSSYITEIDSCPVLVDSIARLLPELMALVARLDARRSIPQIEVAAGDAEAALVVRHLAPLSPHDGQLLYAFGETQNVRIYLQSGGRDSVKMIVPRDGQECLEYELPAHDLRIEFHPLDFTQVNLATNRLMIDQAIAMLALERDDLVLDLFCGIGNLTLPVARHVQDVVGIEGSEPATQRAEHNARRNRVDNARFDCRDLHDRDVAQSVVEGESRKVVIDPPRSGAQEICRALAGSKVGRVLYISCNPVTLARDSRILVEGGFVLERAGIVNMFPHTSHVEAMAGFVRHGQ